MGMFEQFPYTNFHELNLDSLVKMVADVKTNIDGLLDEAKAYTDQIKTQVDAELAAALLEVDNKIDAAATEFDELYNNMQSLLNEYLLDSKNYTDDEIATVITYVDQQLANVGLEVIDPVTGTLGSVQTAIYSLYGLHTGDTLTAAEYDALDLTATIYDGKQLTASQYDLQGKTLLP